MIWNRISLEDLKKVQECSLKNDFSANNYSALSMFLYSSKYDSEISITGGWLFERYFRNKKRYYSFPHSLSADISGVKEPLLLIKNEAEKENIPLCFGNVTVEEKNILLSCFDKAFAEKDDGLSDYIYLTEDLSLLSGKKYSRKRNHISQFRKKYGEWYFENLSQKNMKQALLIEENWFSENCENEEALKDLQAEKEIIYSIYSNFDFFTSVCGMKGGILSSRGEPFAFCISSVLSKDVTDVHFEKCLSDYASDGGYAVINRAFSESVCTKFINREEDLGIEGLRKAKLSYYPYVILEKYNVKVTG